MTADFTKGMIRFVEEFGVNIVGGMLGTMPEASEAVVEAVGVPNQSPRMAIRGRSPKARDVQIEPPEFKSVTGAQTSVRTTAISSSQSGRTPTAAGKFPRPAEGRRLGRAGQHGARRDEKKRLAHAGRVRRFRRQRCVRDMHESCRASSRRSTRPLMLDSTNPAVMEAVEAAGGRCVLNSMNLRTGKSASRKSCALAKKYGAAIVAGTIDEDKLQAMARTASGIFPSDAHPRSRVKYGLRDEDILFDPLGLADQHRIEEDRRNALEQ